ncbi:DUF4129 domain-containing protein [Chryseobacterium sp. GMJ5]|uniref:DUF4129 domain-containing protein n=1 Tax=Chryseobacterium gilvum TaxID=2976534 RepID=A0ABT2VVW8_9FLAO|nr:DUF4129 domain-containing protein [Chryseobacterium gilvum]MCU7614146.1 DUF4129 domain-containing protein [Chryseobacterium gilvum]
MNKILLFVLLFFTFGSSKAQVYDSVSVGEDYFQDSLEEGNYKNMLPADSVLRRNNISENTVYPKKFKENIQSRYRGKEFDYSTSKPRESFLEKLRRKFFRLIQSIFGETSLETSASVANIIIRLFAIVLVGFLLYFIIRYLIGKNGNFIFGKRNKKVLIKDEELQENIHEINFPESIAGFERSGDYRSAIRYQFLFILKKLSDKKQILWNPEKTNKDYTAELKDAYYRTDFSNLVYIFDYVWYGEFSIDEQNYTKFKNQFQAFKP